MNLHWDDFGGLGSLDTSSWVPYSMVLGWEHLQGQPYMRSCTAVQTAGLLLNRRPPAAVSSAHHWLGRGKLHAKHGTTLSVTDDVFAARRNPSLDQCCCVWGSSTKPQSSERVLLLDHAASSSDNAPVPLTSHTRGRRLWAGGHWAQWYRR